MKINNKIYNLRNVWKVEKYDGKRYTDNTAKVEVPYYTIQIYVLDKNHYLTEQWDSKDERDDVFLEIESLIDQLERTY